MANGVIWRSANLFFGHARISRMRGFLRSIGPELISGASDNDPTNVGTAAAVGASTGYQLAWVALLVAPLLGVVQTIAAHVGSVARSDLQTLTLKRYGRGVAALLLASVVIVNVVTIAADLQAGAAGIGLVAGVDSRWLVMPFGVVLVALLVAGRYGQVVGVLRYLLLGFLAFGVAAFLARPDWSSVLRSSLVPTLTLKRDVVGGGLALLGTTLTSYVYVWETIGRGVEEPPDPKSEGPGLARARLGAIIGAVLTAVVLWFMLIASAATLGQHHRSVTSAQEAARALRPLAGSLASDVFALGLVISAVVALPVLMATTAYVVGAQFRLAPRALRTGRPRPGLLRRSGGVDRARLRGEPGQDLGHRHAGRRQRDRGIRNPHRPRDPRPPGPGPLGHGHPSPFRVGWQSPDGRSLWSSVALGCSSSSELCGPLSSHQQTATDVPGRMQRSRLPVPYGMKH